MKLQQNIRWIFGSLILLNGLLVASTPTVLFPVCKSGGVRMACYYTKQAEIGLGLAIAFIGLLLLLIQKREIRIGLSLSLLPLVALVIVYPTYLLGVCHSNSMSCHVGTLPALRVAGSILVVITLIYLRLLTRKEEEHVDRR